MSHDPTPRCPRCGAPLEENRVDGLCAHCLAALNFAADSVVTGEGAAPMPPLTPEEIAPHFPQLEILACLGRGGMGVVYQARQRALGRLVALKLLAPERIADPKFAERFAHEAKALAALSHPNIVTIHDFGQAGGFYFLLMEFVNGVNLRQAMKAGRFTPEQALAIVPPVCEALQYAHEHGIVHRDIKPENLLLDKGGRVKIADFGVAKMLGADGAGGDLSESQPAGTPQYMAPEQKDHRRTDHRADIYSLGVVLYEMLTGELPTDQWQPPSKRVQVDVRIDEIVLRALEVNPELRFQTAADLRTWVEEVKGGKAVEQTAAPASGSEDLSSPPRFSRAAIVGASWVAVTFLSFAAVVLGVRHWRGGSTAQLEWWQLAILSPALVLGVAGPFGTTILGWVAVSRIRRSAGRIQGLPLALFDGLLFPLMTLSAVVAVAGVALAKMLVDFYANPSVIGHPNIALITRMANWLSLHNGVAVVGGAIAAVAVDGLIVRGVMRAVGGEASPTPPESSATSNEIKAASIAVIFALISSALGALASLRGPEAWPALVSSLLFAGLALFMALPARRSGVGKCALTVAALGLVIWPVIGFAVWRGRTAPGTESVEVTKDRAVISQSRYDLEGMVISFGNAPDRWAPKSVYIEAMFDVTLEPHRLGGADWVVKGRHGTLSGYRLEGPPGAMVGKIAFHPGTPTREADGSYVIGDFKPDGGEPFSIAIRLEKDQQTNSSAAGASGGRDSLPAAVASRNFPLRHQLGSEMAEALRRQVVPERPGCSVTYAEDNQSVTVTAPPDVLTRAQTFISVTDWPDPLQDASNRYLTDTVLRTARSVFHACAVEDSVERVSDLLSLQVLAELRGGERSAQYFDYMIGGVPDPEWEKALRGDWPGKKEAVQRFIGGWNRYPVRQIRELPGMAIGFGVKQFCSVAFEGAPKEFYEITLERDRSKSAHTGDGRYLFSDLPPWWESHPTDPSGPKPAAHAGAED